ncbi:MAG: TonB-dependent receptor [Cyclobacteriaceae bacterium]|nr:TonB-dependent receptor [Cyclobacteriaceae bacterium]
MKINTYKNYVFQWVLVFILMPFAGIAQEHKTQLHIIDASSQKPIIGAAYQYGNEKGISDADGIIIISFNKDNTLYLSHVSYGKWQLSGNELAAAIKNGKIERNEEFITMQPVTILGLKPNSNENDKLDIKQPDRLAHDAGYVLSKNAAISGIRKSGSYGFDPVLRGFKYDQLNIVIDGAQSATAACPNRMDPPTSQVSINMMDRVEILKGPHSLRYGSSFGGTINFISVAPDFSSNEGLYGRASTTYETNGSSIRSEGKLGYRNSKYDLNVYGAWSQGNDYTDGEGVAIPSSFLRGSFGTSLGIQLNKNQEVIVSATRNVARNTDFPALQMDLRSDDTWLLNAKHKINFSGRNLQSWNTTVYTTLVNHVMDNLSKELFPRMLNAVTDANTQNYGARTEGLWKISKGSLYLGADYKVERADGYRTRELLMGPMAGTTLTDNIWQKSNISKTAGFGEYHLTLGSNNLVFSGRVEVNTAKANDAAPEFTTVNPETEITQVNPSLSIGGIHNFNNSLSAGLWLGRAQRSGSITERYINFLPVGLDPYEMVGTPDIKPEINNQADLNLGYKTPDTAIKLSLFASYLQNYISSEIDPALAPRMPSSPGVRRFINIDQALMSGFELTWNQQLFAGLTHQLSMAYTYGQNLESDQPLSEIAPMDMRYTISGSYVNGKLVPEASVRYVLKQDRISPEFGETETPSFTLVDASVNYKISKVLSATIGAQNIFDAAYYEHLNRSVPGTSPRPIYAPGRNFFASLLVNFQ